MTTAVYGHRLPRVLHICSVAAIYGFILAPVVVVVWISFFRNEIVAFPPDGYTLKWFANAAADPTFTRGFILSLEVAAIAAVVGVGFGTLAALALVRYRFPGREFLSMLLLAPLIVPAIVAGTALYIFYIGVEDAWDVQFTATFPGLVIAHVLLTIPWSVRLVSANLVGLDMTLEEAAQNLGAGRWVTFYRVTLPLMRAGIVAAALFSFIVSFENLELSLFLVGPGRTTLPIAILQYLEFKIDPTIAAVATVQVVLIGAAMMLSDRFVKLSQVV